MDTSSQAFIEGLYAYVMSTLRICDKYFTHMW